MNIQNPCALLDRLLQEPAESAWLEFKVNNSDPEQIGEYISALANSAMLSGKDRAFLVFGIEDKTKNRIGTSIRLNKIKVGNEPLESWLARLIEPRIVIDLLDFDCDQKEFSIISIDLAYDRPICFRGIEYIRIGESKKKLRNFTEHERALWLATGRRKFEDAVALTHQSASDVFHKLDASTFYTLADEAMPKNESEILRRMTSTGILSDNLEGGFDVTNLGAILLAKDINQFPSIATKSVRIIKYAGTDKNKSEFEQEGAMGYAVGFSGMMRFLMQRLPSEEKYIDGVRKKISLYPEIAIREIIANALIHQDFTMSGAGPVIEIYSNRIEVTNPGNSLIETDRMLDERRSRNEKLASTMRTLGLCEERGGGLDKTMIEIELMHLPAPELNSSENSMRVVLFGPRPFSQMTKAEKLRACFFHCVLRWITHDFMSNSSLRERFSLADEEYQAASALIAEAIKSGRIAPADPHQGNRNARYIPYWAV